MEQNLKFKQKLIIFDLDGVLINSLPNMKFALANTAIHINQKISFKRYRKYIGLPFEKILRELNVKGDYNHKRTKLDIFSPKMSKPENGECDPLFFKPNDHMQHMQHMKLTDTSYLEHMIPHHQVAIDMSKRLLLHTKHSYMIEFCKNLIVEQQGEIYLMNNMLKNRFNNYSELLN